MDFYRGPIYYASLFQQIITLYNSIENSSVNIRKYNHPFPFESWLNFCHTFEDTIRYYSKFDSLNFQVASYKTGLKECQKFIKDNFNKHVLEQEKLKSLFKSVSFTLSIDKYGKAKLKKIDENSFKSYSDNFKNELAKVVEAMPDFSPAFFKGKKVEMDKYVLVSFK